MRTWSHGLMTIALLIHLSVAEAPARPAERPSVGAPNASLRVLHTWEYEAAGHVYRATVPSLATAMDAHCLVTHNHYAAGLGRLRNERLTLVDAAGQTRQLPAAALRFEALDAGTLLIHLPDDVSLATASLDMGPQAPQRGDWVTVTFWDDEAGRVAREAFQVVAIQAGVARLADPRHRINGGDSGGGVFFRGRLVGNNWSVITDPAGEPVGAFNVALLPAALATTASEAATALAELAAPAGGEAWLGGWRPAAPADRDQAAA